MRKLIPAIAAALIVLGVGAIAQTVIQREVITGPHMPTGDKLNQMIDAINNLQGTGTPGAVTATTFVGSGSFTLTGTAASSGVTCPSFVMYGAPAAVSDTVFYIAPRAMRVVSISEIHAVAAGGASVLQVTKDTGTNAPGAGTDLLTNNTNTGFDLAATANTVQVGTLTATAASLLLAAGDRLAVDFAQAIQSTSGVTVTACMAPR